MSDGRQFDRNRAAGGMWTFSLGPKAEVMGCDYSNLVQQLKQRVVIISLNQEQCSDWWDAIICTQPKSQIIQSVSQWQSVSASLIVSDFGDSYRIYRACKLVLIINMFTRIPKQSWHFVTIVKIVKVVKVVKLLKNVKNVKIVKVDKLFQKM